MRRLSGLGDLSARGIPKNGTRWMKVSRADAGLAEAEPDCACRSGTNRARFKVCSIKRVASREATASHPSRAKQSSGGFMRQYHVYGAAHLA